MKDPSQSEGIPMSEDFAEGSQHCRECDVDADTFGDLLEHADETGHTVVG